MKTAVRESSREIYYSEIISKEAGQKQLIMDYMKSRRRATGRMIAKALGMETGTVSARVHSLVEEDKSLFREISLNKCPVSERNVHWIYIQPTQPSLFQ